jgi:deazaflavin-dependent oxidoreductase (nitroreductase family)
MWRIMRWLNPRLQSRFQSGDKPSELVLMLSTTGRKTGNIHKTPLQYEFVDGDYYVGSARGPKADWYRNILSNPKVRVSVGGKEFPAIAEPITAAGQIADFIELRLKRRRWMIKILMRMEGLAFNHTREELEEFARQKAIVVLHPLN